MARRYEFEASARSSATAEAIWPLVGEAARWKEWSWMTRTTLLRDGDPAPDGVGALRRFALGPAGARRRSSPGIRPTTSATSRCGGLPVRHYRADVDLDDDGTGTVVTWRCSFDAARPRHRRRPRASSCARMVQGFARRVCRYADRIALDEP